MSGWGKGYVTDIDYLPGWYFQQSPMHMALASLLLGFASDLPGDEEDIHYVELGCGLGFGAMVLAAANPRWRITAIDFNPAHIAQARAIARDAGLPNIAFLEADLATLMDEEDGRRLPQADFISMHGVWSWVSPAVRAGIVRLLRAKLVAGGVLHVSYNALPAWQSGIGMQRLFLMAGQRGTGTTDQQAMVGIDLMRRLLAAEALHLHGSMVPRRMADRLATMPPEYVSHEFMNRNWSPCFHADVVVDMAEAKLDWIGSASLLDNYANLALSEAQRAIYSEMDDPLLRELVKDMCLPRSLRHDLFVRGAQRISASTRDAALRDVTLALTVPTADASYEIDTGGGTATLSEAYYGPILQQLEMGPRKVSDLLAMATSGGAETDPRELVGVLVGIGHALPMLRPDRPVDAGARRFNSVAARWLAAPQNFNKSLALASTAVGGGFPASVFDLFVVERLQAGDDLNDADAWINGLLGDRVHPDRENLRTAMVRVMERRLPLLRVASVV